MKKFVFVLLALLVCSTALAAGIEEKIMRDWTRSERFADSGAGQTVELKVTYYSAEYVEALVQSEAEKNMWTGDEVERYKYNLLKSLNLDENIAFHVDLNVLGTPAYIQPMDKFFKLRIGRKVHDAADYDKKFNFKLSGRRDGMIWFRRFDEKTGKSLLDGVNDIRMIIMAQFTQATAGKGDISLIWTIAKDDPSVLYKGKAADRIELDRLIKRLEKLTKDKKDLEGQLKKVNDELDTINKRVDELQK